jgi:tetratricopeptide (TPR) repeat protein
MPDSPEDAEKMSDKMEQSKNIALAYANLGSIYERKGETEKALTAIEKAIAIDPNDFVAYNTRGKIKIKQNDLDGAISDFNRAIKTMPSMSDSYLGRGIAFLLQGKEAEAQKDFDKYLQIFPNGKMYLEKQIEEAKRKLQK